MEKKCRLEDAFSIDGEGYVTRTDFERVLTEYSITTTSQERTELYADLDIKEGGKFLFSDIALKIVASEKGDIKSEAERDFKTESLIKEREVMDFESLKSKLSIMEERERIALDRALREKAQSAKFQEMLKTLNEACDSKDADKKELSERYHQLKEEYNKIKGQLDDSLTRQEATDMQVKYQVMERELSDKEAALLTFRDMSDSFSQQIRSLEIAFARKKDEGYQMHRALLDIQSGKDIDNLVGKLYYVVLLSRWQEASTNRKYDNAMNDVQKMRTMIYTSEQTIDKYEEEIRTLKKAEHENQQLLIDFGKQLKMTENDRRAVKRVDELMIKLKELTDAKIDLEVKNNDLREENNTLKNDLEELEFEKSEANDLAACLKAKDDRELSQKLVEYSHKLGNLKILELRATRDAKILKDREAYLEKLNAQASIHTKRLEDELVALQAEKQKIEDEYRAKDQERQRFFFEQRERRAQPIKTESIFGPDDELKKISEKSGASQKQEIPQLSLPADVRKQLREQEETINKLKKELEDKEKQLGRSVQITGDKEKTKIDTQFEWEEEKRQMSEVAFNTIKTLESIIENQTKQLKRKDDIIKNERDKAVLDMKQKSKEIEDMQRELNAFSQKELGKLMTGKGSASVYGVQDRGEIEAKNEQIKMHDKKIRLLESEIDNRDNKIRGYENKLRELEATIEKQKGQDKSEIANKELKRVKRELQEKTKNFNSLTKDLKDLKNELEEYQKSKATKAADLDAHSVTVKSLESDIDKMNKQLKKARADLEKQELKVKETTEKFDKEEEKILELTKQNAQIKKEMEAEKKLRIDKERELEIEKSKNRAVQTRAEEEKKQSTYQRQFASTGEQNEIQKLKSELADYKLKLNPNMDVNIILNPQTATFEAKDAQEISGSYYIDEIIARTREKINTQLRPIEILRAYAEYRPVITDDQFLMACMKFGVCYPGESKNILLNKLKVSPRDLDFGYDEFANALRGVPFNRFIDPELYSLGKCVAELNLTQQELAKQFPGIGMDGFVSKQVIEDGIGGLSKAELNKEKQYILPRIPGNETAETYNAFTLLKLLDHAAKVYMMELFRKTAQEKKKNMVELFASYDNNKDRKLEASEFEKLLIEMDLNLVGSQLEWMRDIFDPEHTGLYDFSWYCDLLSLSPEESIFFSFLFF